MNLDNDEWLIKDGILIKYKKFECNPKSIIIPEGVLEIGGSSFYNRSLENVILPNSLIKVGSCAFYNNNITKLTIPRKVKIIEWKAFYHNQITSVMIMKETKISDDSFDSFTEIIRVPKELEIKVEKEETELEKVNRDKKRILELLRK